MQGLLYVELSPYGIAKVTSKYHAYTPFYYSLASLSNTMVTYYSDSIFETCNLFMYSQPAIYNLLWKAVKINFFRCFKVIRMHKNAE